MSKKKNNYEDSFHLNFNASPDKLQKNVLSFLKTNQLSVLCGDPGTGKTFLAMYHALELLKDGAVKEIIISKPLREVGQSMGYLPGGEDEKIAAYLEPFMDAVDTIVAPGTYNYLVTSKRLRFEAHNFVRGKNFKYACVIMDEAQNANLSELLAFTTRLGSTSSTILLGDVLQADIRNSGLSTFINKIIVEVDGAGFLELGEEYQKRSGLVLQLYKNYKKHLYETGVLSL